MLRRSPVLIAVFGVAVGAGLVPARAAAASMPAPAIRTLSASGVSVESAALLLSGQEGGEIPVGVVAVAAPGEEGKTKVLFRLRIGGPALLAGQTRDTLRTEVSLYLLDAGGGVQGSLLETVEVDLASLRGAVERSGVDFLGSFLLRPGPYSLRMLARNLETGHIGVRTAALPVPDPAGLQPQPLSPPPPSDPRPTVRSSSLGPLDPPLFPDDPAGSTQQAAAAPDAGTAPAPPVPSLSETAEGRQIQKAVRADYRAALGRLAAGKEAEALAAVAAFEDSLLRRSEKPVRLEQLAEVEAGVARDLAAVDPESLVPLLRFHQRLYEEGTAKRRYPGATQAQEMVLRLAALHRERGRPELARRFECTLGVELLRAGLRRQGEQVLQRVLAEDPGDPIARLELAVHAERRGVRDEALSHLEALLRAHPDDREARLRLAVDLARLGRREEAEEGLRRVIRDETGGWRLHLAYQELARLFLESDPAKAEATLREGLERLPSDEKLTLLLAALRERRGEPAAAREALAALAPEGNDGGGTARHRYNRPPVEPFDTTLADLGREATARLPNLAAALGRRK